MSSTRDSIENIAVSDFMTKNVRTITEKETMKQACKLMYQDNIGSIVILKDKTDDHESKTSGTTTSKKEMPMGIVTERDIAKMVGFSDKFFADTPVSEVMSKPVITVDPDTTVKDAVILMEQKGIRRLPIVNDTEQMVGIITAKDILKAVMKTFKKNIRNQDLTSEGFDLLGFLGAE
jgi:CBS domain-containing protein